MKKEDYNRRWRELVAELEAIYPDDPEMQDKLEREFAVRNYKQEWKDFLEEEADMNTLTFLPPPLRKRVESMIKLEREIEELRERRAKRRGQKTEGGGL